MSATEKHRIRPAGRHLLTIGEDLIQDHYAAVIELVKNAYDADARSVTVSIGLSEDEESVIITVSDDGHGMSKKVVIDQWLVPSTKGKVESRVSPGGRVMQGRKGIGRYAASILGSDLRLETISAGGERTEVYLEWARFETAEYLSDVEIDVLASHTNDSCGTKLTITGKGKYRAAWSSNEIKTLEFELQKLISPVEKIQAAKAGNTAFSIIIIVDGFFFESNKIYKKEIQPIPLFELYDYRVSGSIEKNGTGLLVFKNQKAKNTVDETIPVKLKYETGCGKLSFDIRVYDRESDAIDQLIRRGLVNDAGNYVGKNEAKNLLNKNNGIGVYRNGFRIRPLGDPDFDWLKLNEQRVQMPSIRIGSNQVIGYVEIESEELSHLEEKSARDGLKENSAFRNLKDITIAVIRNLEERRFAYRNKAGLSRPVVKVERELEKLFNFEDIKTGIRKKLSRTGIDPKLAEDIVTIITEKEDKNNKIVEDIRRAVAIYQGQATLGKIINVILHEGRRPLNYFKSQIPNLNIWVDEFKVERVDQYLDEIVSIADGIRKSAQMFVNLFGKLDPLAAAKRKAKEQFDIVLTVKKSFDVFEEELIKNNIYIKLESDLDAVPFTGWSSDIYIIMTNLIENSIFWISEKESRNRYLNVKIVSSNGSLSYLDYRDSGPGIEKHLIESQVIFEPEFSTKPSGTGLGLAIAGEAASRNGLQIQAFESDNGAYFRLQPFGGV
ncbi:ATP-binding protein [Geomonas ferrireducens]|uniref:ATP-binding protein n=1 Tax=Geomonas ferrireducens TaxID=2570227 RepID=UPI0010A828B6|nr:ATP-binding protein [Geomonas ferrireducens]